MHSPRILTLKITSKSGSRKLRSFWTTDMSVVKEETTAGDFCHGCLSTGRRTAPLGDYSKLFYTLIGPQKPFTVYNNDDVNLCWECKAIMEKLGAFQNQIKTAQSMLVKRLMLYQMSPNVAPLSNLSTYHKDFFDLELNHLEIVDTKTDIDTKTLVIPKVIEPLTVKEEIDDTLEDEGNKEDYMDFEEYSNEIDSTNDNIIEYSNEIDDTKDSIITKEEVVPNTETVSKKKKQEYSLVSKYRMYARKICKENNWDNNPEKYFNKVFLTEKEMEDLITKSDRKAKTYRKLRHKCRECKLGYRRVVDYNRHKDLNHHKSGTPYRCRECNKCTPSLEALSEHWREHNGMFQCSLCGEYCGPRTFERHLDLKHTTNYGCKDCRLEFVSLKKFAQHYKKSHGTYICHHCGKECRSRRIIERHLAYHHIDHYCKICGRCYENRRRYQNHLRCLHPMEMNINEDPELAFCVECNRQYPSVAMYKLHIYTKHTPRAKPDPVPCPECGKMFLNKHKANSHYKVMHLKVTKFYCEPCNKYYGNSAGLKWHNESIHLKLPKIKDKICDLCGRGFNTNRILQNHRRTHTGERPYKCSYCTASFAQLTAMKNHQRTQHKEHVELKTNKNIHPGQSRGIILEPGTSRGKSLEGEGRDKFLHQNDSAAILHHLL